MYLLIVIAFFVVTACTLSNPADRFAGKWTGTMSFSAGILDFNASTVQVIELPDIGED